jgi:hypothetical protein
MSATDLDNGTTRLETAKQEIGTLIDRMKTSDAAMLISFSDTAVVHQSYTTNKSQLKRKLASIEQTMRGSELNEALLAASGLANPGRTSDRNSNIDVQVAEALEATLFLFTDGGVAKVPDFSLGNLTPEYRPIGAIDPPGNIGITAFSLNDQMEFGEQVQVFARLSNSGMEEQVVGVSLFVDEQLQDARGTVTVPGLGSTRLHFDLTGLNKELESPIPIRLEIEDADVYLQDNVAWCILNPPRESRVLVISDSNKYIELALQTSRSNKIADVQFENRDYLAEKSYLEAATLGLYDLILFDQCAPPQMPACNTVFWGEIPAGDRWQVAETLTTTPIIDTNSAHPLMYAVPMGSVNILNGQTLTGPQGSISLLDSAGGSVMMLGPRGSFEDLVIGFPLVEYLEAGDISINTDWPKKLSFPLFMQNILARLGGVQQLSAARSISPGELMTIKTSKPTDSIKIRTPGGQSVRLRPQPDNRFVFSLTEEVGVYEVRDSDSGDLDQLFAVNLLDRTESDLAVREELQLGYSEIDGKRTVAPARIDYWMWLVMGALVVLSLEWIIYNRRVFI